MLVAAMDMKRGVGLGGGIPWSLPEDLKRFRSLTLGGAVCYGRRTQESLSDGYLNGRYNILLSKTRLPADFDPNGSVCSSVREALDIVEAQNLGPLFVLGGTRAWEEAGELIHAGIPAVAFITQVEGDFECDTFFPTLRMTCVHEGPLQAGPPPSRFRVFTNV